MDDRVPERRDSHASSSHEPSLEPTRSADLGQHSVKTHFPKDGNCEICQRIKITRAPCRRRIGGAVPRAEIFGDFITADHKILSEGCESRNNHRYAIVVQDLATQWLQSCPCKSKTSQETQRSLHKFLEPDRKHRVIYTDNSSEFCKACEGIIVRRHHTDRKQVISLKEQYAESKKAPLPYCCNQVWIKIGGQVLWNVTPFCETFKISCLMGKLHTRDVLGNRFKDRSFRLVHWLSITLFLRKTSQESINLERKSCLYCSSETLCTRGEIGRVTYWLQTLRSWKRWTHQKSTSKDSMQRK